MGVGRIGPLEVGSVSMSIGGHANIWDMLDERLLDRSSEKGKLGVWRFVRLIKHHLFYWSAIANWKLICYSAHLNSLELQAH